MRKIMFVTSAVAGAALVLLSAGPAFAANTDTSFTLVGGALAISAPVGPVSLGTGPASVNAQTVTGALGAVTVTDSRGAGLGWTATAISTAFTSGALSVPASAISYALSVPTKTGISLIVPSAATDLTTAKTVETATAVVGANTAAWNPNISIAVPAGAQTGVYNAAMTHSVI
jgi:hypothetical protein